jgi:Leucine-rich repeat (LRR) protein
MPLAILPDTVSKLVSLKYLILNNTEVSSLPASLGDLPALELLEIVDSKVKTILPQYTPVLM